MMFSCCHPDIPEEAQVALVLSLLCGFSAQEVAGAFLVSRRGDGEAARRGRRRCCPGLGSSSSSARATSRRASPPCTARSISSSTRATTAPRRTRRCGSDLCREAMRLVALLVEHAPAATPATHALAALMAPRRGPAPRAGGRGGRSHRALPSGPEPLGRRGSSPAGSSCSRRRPAARWSPSTTSRRPSPPPTRSPRAPRRRRGPRSSSCTTPSCAFAPRRWWR